MIGSTAAKEALIQYVDKVFSTTNQAVLPDGINVNEDLPPNTNPYICNLPYSQVEDFDHDLADLNATCQRHTRCSAAYCLRTQNNQQKCRFSYPKPLQPETALVTDTVLLQLLLETKVSSTASTLFSCLQCMVCQCGHAVLCVASQGYCVLC